ncbi:MAG: ATP-binding protein [Lentisphaeria bacterium]
MFEFKYVELMNWAYWPTVKMPLDQRTMMITGPNGSGKTTFLDAIKTLLRAPRLSSGRRFTDYLIGNVGTAVVKAVVTNEAVNGDFRPFEFRGFSSDLATLALVMQKKSGRWEKRFAMLDGDVPFEHLKTLQGADLITPSGYSHELNQAGFTSTLTKVLALEQGQTDQLCNRSAKELLDLLLDVHGDKEIIDRYKSARENYQAASMELGQLGARLAEEQAKLMTAQKAADEYRRFEKLKGELRDLEEVWIPQAEYKAAGSQFGELQLAIDEHNTRLSPLDREIIEIQTKLDNAETELERRKSEVLTARDTKEEMDKNEREHDILLARLMEERQQLTEITATVKGAKAEPVEPLRAEREDIRRGLLKLELEGDELNRKCEDLNSELADSDQRERKIYPSYVADFIQVLKSSKIDFRLLCDLVEVSELEWQLAIESLLGRDRFCVLVEPKNQLKARQLAEKYRYRGYIVEWDRKAEVTRRPRYENSALQYIEFSEAGVPDWVVDVLDHTRLVGTVEEGSDLDDVSVTHKGYRQDRRGGISIAVDHFYCGSLGQSSQKKYLEEALLEAQKRLGQINKEKGKHDKNEEKLSERINVQEMILQASDADARMQMLSEQITMTNTKHHESLALKRSAEQKLLDVLEELNNFERDCTEQSKWLVEKRSSRSEHLSEIEEQQRVVTQLTKQRTKIEKRLDEALLTDKALEDVADIDELTPRYYAVQSLLEEFGEAPDGTVVDVYDHYKSQYEHQRTVYSDHEAGLRNWENEFLQARDKYLVVVEHTIREYRKNVLSLAEIAGVSTEVVVPNLEDDKAGLENAELVVRFGFDGKRAAEIGGVGHSGGQRVVSSLILLMSLATSGGQRGGFFIIDEPFAHLSIERIDDVSRFLNQTECQFILTSPTTHNVNVFSASRLQLNFRIKRQGEDFAPIPTVIRR